MRELAQGRFYDMVAQSWWMNDEFSEKPLNLQWRLACFRSGLKLPFPLHERNLRANERIAPANLTVYALLLNPSITGEFFTSDKNNQGLQVYIKRGHERIIFPEHVFFKSHEIAGLATEVLPDK